jgi:hypothetical protein
MRKAVTLLLLGLGVALLRAGESPAPAGSDPLKQICDRVMAALSEGDTNQTIPELFRPCWSFTGTNAARGSQLAADMRLAVNQIEMTVGRRLNGRMEFLGARRLGTTFVTYCYVQKYEHAGLLFNFSFYRAKDAWLLDGVNWSPDPKADSTLWSQENHPPAAEFDPVRQALDKAMTALSGGQTNAVFVDLFTRCWPVREAATGQAEVFAAEIRTATPQLEASFGRRLPGRWEFIGVRRLGTTYYTLVYLLKHENGAVPVSFNFYQSPAGWLLNDATYAEGAQADLAGVTLIEPGK